MTMQDVTIRQEIIDNCRKMNSLGINQGTSGNISVRQGDHMLITPSSIPYDQMVPEMICRVALDDPEGKWEGPKKPSTEWRFHQRILRDRPDCHAVVHAHPNFATSLAIINRGIPAVHYMIAVFGGSTVRCCDFARFGTDALSELVMGALEDRTACLMANHGMIAIGDTVEKAMWRAVELETLAKQYVTILQTGIDPVILTDEQIDETLAAFGGYGLQSDHREA